MAVRRLGVVVSGDMMVTGLSVINRLNVMVCRLNVVIRGLSIAVMAVSLVVT